MALVEIGGVVINTNNLISFKVTRKKDTYFLKLLMLNGTGYNISYENPDHLLRDVKKIENATK